MTDAILEDAAAILPVERALIGAILFWPGLTMPPLLPNEFMHLGHQRLWETMLELEERDGRASLAALEKTLFDRGQLGEVGGSYYLQFLFVEAHVPGFIPSLSRQIRDANRARKLRELGHELAASGLDADQVSARLESLPGPLAGAIFDAEVTWKRIVERWSQGQIKTQMARLDTMTSGMGRGELVAIGGRTSHGKTAFATHLALRLANAEIPVAFLTLEESEEAIVRRMVSNLTRIPNWRLKDGQLSTQERSDAEEAIRWLQAIPLALTSLESMRNLDEEHVVGVVAGQRQEVVIIDHLQKITTSDASRVYGIERVLNRLHAVALRSQRVIVMNCQLRRDVETDKRPPVLSDLRDSGAIEQSARQVWLLHWPVKYDGTRDPAEYEVYVAKNAEGGTGLVQLTFDPTCGRFSE